MGGCGGRKQRPQHSNGMSVMARARNANLNGSTTGSVVCSIDHATGLSSRAIAAGAREMTREFAVAQKVFDKSFFFHCGASLSLYFTLFCTTRVQPIVIGC